MKLKSLALATSLFAAAQSQGAIVLTINIANPSAVVITGVANNSQITASGPVDFGGGISLRNFFTQNETITNTPAAITGTWTPRGTSTTFNEMVTFAFGSPDVVPGVDLSVYNTVLNSGTISLSDSAAPFTGSSTVNLAAYNQLPAVGATGDINLGYLGTQGGVIGQWQVIPEPSSAIIGALGAVGLLRRRRC